jgi:MraZ protein
MALTGSYPRTLDDKKRVALPKRVREELGNPERLFVTKGLDQCLWLYSQAEFDKVADNLGESTGPVREVEVFRKLFFAATEMVDVDRSGRILIPERLIQFAGLKHDLMLNGNGKRLELWDSERWQEYEAQNALRFDAVAEQAFQKK